MATLLTYTINSDNADPTPGIADFYFNISVENNGYSPVTLQYFQIAIPMGDGENDLTPTGDTASIVYKVPTGWVASPAISAAGDYLNVTFGYTGRGGLLISPNSTAIVFGVDNITVNSSAGTADCMLTEFTESPTAVNQGEFSFTKPNTPTSLSFYASSYVVQAGDEVVVYWSGPSGWTYTITYGEEVLPQPTVNEGSYSCKLLTPTIFTLQLTKTGQPPQNPIQFTVKVTPSIVFTGVGQTNNELVLAWSTLYASKLTGSWTAGSLALSSADLPEQIAPHNDWTSSQYILTAFSSDPTDALAYTKTCAVTPPVVNSFAPGSLQQDDNGYYFVLTWDVSGAFYVNGSWVDDTVQFKPQDQSLNIYAPFAAEYTLTAYVLSDVYTTKTIQTADYFAAPIIEQFNGTVEANTLALNWDVQLENQNSPLLSVHGSWQSGSSASLPVTGSQTLNCPFASNYTLTVNGLVSGQSVQQELSILWRVAENIPIKYLPTLSCIAPDNTNCLVGFSGIEDNSGTITFLYGAYIVANGKIANQITLNIGLGTVTSMLTTPDGKNVLFVYQKFDELWQALSYEIGTAQANGSYDLGLASIVAITPDNAYLYAAHLALTTRFNLASGESNVIKMPDYTGANVSCISVSPNGETVFIGVSTDSSGVGYVLPLTVQTNTLLPAIALVNKNPCAIAFAPDNQHALVVSDNDNTVLVIDLSSLSVTATLTVDANPQSIVITPDGRYAFVVNTGSDTVSVIDVNAFTVVQNLPVCSGAKSITVARDSSCIVVSNNTSIVSVIAVETLSIVQTLHIYAVSGVILPPPAFAPDGNSLYIVSAVVGDIGKYSVLVLK